MKIYNKSLPSIVIVCITTCVLMIGVWFLLSKTVDQVVEKEAEKKALHWVNYFDSHLHDINNLIAHGSPNQEQSAVIDKAVSFGEVFLFKIFRPDGTVALKSDEYKVVQDNDYP